MANGAMKQTGQRIVRHFSRDVWAKDLDGLGLWRRRAVAASRLVYMVFSGFMADHCIIQPTVVDTVRSPGARRGASANKPPGISPPTVENSSAPR